MTRDQYWKIIEGAKVPDEYDSNARLQSERIRQALRSYSKEDLIDFSYFESIDLFSAYDERLAAAAYLVSGFPSMRLFSSDGYDYFIGWLISLGRTAFNRILTHPETIGAYLPNHTPLDVNPWFGVDGAWMLDLGQFVYEDLFGEDLPDESRPIGSTEFRGESWDPDKVDDMFPGLSYICHYPTADAQTFRNLPVLFEYLTSHNWNFVGRETLAVSHSTILAVTGFSPVIEFRSLHSGKIQVSVNSESEAIATIRALSLTGIP